jgi:Fic family protein
MRSLEKVSPISLTHFKPERIIELLNNPDFNRLLNRVNEEYYYWDKVKYLPMPEGINPIEVWSFAKFRRLQSPYKIQFGNYQFGWTLPARIQERLHQFDLHIGGSLETRSLISAEDKNRYLVSSIMEEAIASSQIEGAVTTRKQAKEILRKRLSPKNKSELMIVNNYHTIQKILELKDQMLTPELLLEVHKLITAGTLDHQEDEGAFRTSNDINVIDPIDNEVMYYPPGVDELPALIKDLCSFFNDDRASVFMHPIIKGCIIHFMIGFIHPFADGNGRTARALFYWYLLKKGYWLTEYLSISRLILRSKNQYARAYLFTETDDNDLTYFISYQVRTMKLAYDSLREYLQRKIEEKRQITAFLKIEHVNERQALMLKWVYEEPSLLFTAKEVETRLGISNQTARTDLQGLAKEGFLEEVRMNKKTVAFGKSSRFDVLLNQHFQGGKLF